MRCAEIRVSIREGTRKPQTMQQTKSIYFAPYLIPALIPSIRKRKNSFLLQLPCCKLAEHEGEKPSAHHGEKNVAFFRGEYLSKQTDSLLLRVSPTLGPVVGKKIPQDMGFASQPCDLRTQWGSAICLS
jgi:hypothetical protein